jgi:hypothetical protein
VRPMVRSDMPSLPLEWQGKLSNQRTAWEGSCRSLGALANEQPLMPNPDGRPSSNRRNHTETGQL